MHQYIYQTIGLPIIYLSIEGRDVATMAIQRNVMPDIIKTLARDCFHNGAIEDKQALLRIIEELTTLLD